MNINKFQLDDLVQVYSRPNLHSVIPGNKVELRSGGPCMIVEDSWNNQEGFTTARVKWDRYDGTIEIHNFDLRMLTCFGAIR